MIRFYELEAGSRPNGNGYQRFDRTLTTYRNVETAPVLNRVAARRTMFWF